MALKGERGAGKKWEIGTDMYTRLILCIKETANEHLLYSTGNSTQHSGYLNVREIQKRGGICICIADSLVGFFVS